MIALPPLAQGTTFAGEYRVLELLSHTNQLALYGVTHVPTGQIRVLELLFSPTVPGQAFRDRFVRAAMDSARAASVIVPRVLAAGIDGASQVPFVALEPFRGEVLATGAARGAGMPVADALTVLGQVATGVRELHAAGLVHGGLRPEAVILTADPTQRLGVKLINASLAKILGDARVATAPSAVPCDPAWASPEQIDGEEPSPLSDVYSFAMLAFNVLTGHRLWRGTAEAQIVREATKEPLPVPTMRAYELGRGGTLPTTFDGWFARCAARSRQERFPSIEAAFFELQGAFHRAASQYTGSIGPSAQGIVPPPPRSSTSGVVIALGVVGALVAFGGLGTLGYHAVQRFQERAHEAKLAAEQRLAAETKTSAGEVTSPPSGEATPANGEQSGVPSIDINALPSRGKSRGDRRDERTDRAERPEARTERVEQAASRVAEVAKPNEPSANTASSPASLAEAPASPAAATGGKLQVIDLSPGRGKAIKSGDKITVRYTGKRQSDGVVYDTSHATAPYTFTLGTGKVTRGWEQGLPGMKVGGKRRLVVPPQLAYGEKGLGAAVPPNSTLIFDLELLSAE